jgi:hypothetical protein
MAVSADSWPPHGDLAAASDDFAAHGPGPRGVALAHMRIRWTADRNPIFIANDKATVRRGHTLDVHRTPFSVPVDHSPLRQNTPNRRAMIAAAATLTFRTAGRIVERP